MAGQLTAIEREKLLKLARDSNLKRKNVGLPAIERMERGSGIPLSFAQQRLWFLAQMPGVSHAYHIPFGVKLKGELQIEALRWALDRIVERHEALRTCFVMVERNAEQRIAAVADSRFTLLEQDLRGAVDAERERDAWIAEEFENGFDLEAGPLIRGRLIREGDDEYTLLIIMHHIVSDGWSMGVLVKELSGLYSGYVRGEKNRLPELAIQYADYAVWQRKWMEGEVLREQAEYWKEALAGAPALLALPTDYARPPEQSYAGGYVELVLDKDLTRGLKDLSRRHAATLYMTLLAAWAALLGKLSGQEEVVVGTPIANRGRLEIEGLIGFFVNTLAIRVETGGSGTIGELLERVKTRTLTAQQHQDIPFERVVELLNPVRSLGHSPLFQAMFAWQNTERGKLDLAGLEARQLESSRFRAAKFDLTLVLWEAGDRIVGGLEYASALFEPGTIELYGGYFRRLLQGMVADETLVVERLPLLSREERQRILYEWNDTAREYPSEKCVHELFEEEAERVPEAVAVEYEEQQLTYRELNRRSTELAHHLLRLGVKPEQRIAICVERSLEMIVGLLGVLKAGAAYVPLDPAYPDDRITHMLKDSGAVALLTSAKLAKQFGETFASVPTLDLTESCAWSGQVQTNTDSASVGITSSRLAYVIYTSGSTGYPKGVMIHHRGVCNQIKALQAKWKLGVQDRFLQFASITFDASIEEIFCALLSGATLVLRGDAWLSSAREFWGFLGSRGITVADLPTRFWSQIVEDTAAAIPVSVRLLITGGETVERKMLANWFEGDRHRPPLWNSYGPTETTVNATLHEITADPSSWSTIGRPITNTRTYILDAAMEPVPIGVRGELYIGGVGVARAYLNRAELTAEHFLSDPFVKEIGARMYKTGDLARWLNDGTIEFLGRNDSQVKIRGFRIELGEIEALLSRHAGVGQAAVVMREDRMGQRQLVGYVGSTDAGLDATELRNYLRRQLPDYMVPAAIVVLAALPLTANGKLDRKALPAPNADTYAVHGYEPPQGEMETRLAEIWAGVLKLDRVGRHDNFFSLGGHSLLAMTLIERMRSGGFPADVRALFTTPTLAQLAATTSMDTPAAVEVPGNLIPAPAARYSSTLKTRAEIRI